MHKVSFEKQLAGSIIFVGQIFIPLKKHQIGGWSDFETMRKEQEQEVLFNTGTLYSPTSFVFHVHLDKTDTSTHGGNKQEMRF